MADIEETLSLFANVDDGDLVCGDCDENEDCEDGCSDAIRMSLAKSLIYHEFVMSKEQFIANNFIADRDADVGVFILALENISEDVSQDEVVIDPTRNEELEDRIDEIIAGLLLQPEAGQTEGGIVSIFSGHIENKYDWFTEHYNVVINEISERELANENDITTLEEKIADLEKRNGHQISKKSG